MEVSGGYLNATPILCPVIECLVCIGMEAGWVPKLAWMLLKKKNILPCWESNPASSVIKLLHKLSYLHTHTHAHTYSVQPNYFVTFYAECKLHLSNSEVQTENLQCEVGDMCVYVRGRSCN